MKKQRCDGNIAECRSSFFQLSSERKDNMAAGSLELIVGRLSSILENEESLPEQARADVSQIISELNKIQESTADADRKKKRNEVARTLVGDITDLVHEVEDIMDEYLYHRIKQQKNGIKCFPMKSRNENENRFLSSLSKVKNGLFSIDINRGASSSNDIAAQSSIFSGNDDVVGIEENGELLFRWLVDSESRLTLNWVVGMGGVGKTTLVGEIFKFHGAYDCFDCCAWVTVSQSYTTKSLLKTIMQHLLPSKDMEMEYSKVIDATAHVGSRKLVEIVRAMEYMEDRQVVEIIGAYLQDKRYLIVLDDVWDNDVWNRLKDAFPDNGRRSRIVITTRRKDVAHQSSSGYVSHVLDLQPLKDNEAWNLFCRRAFLHGSSKDCPPDLEKSAQAIVAICEGLPLAVVAFGNLMSQKTKTQNEWEKEEKSLSEHGIK